jgi:uncharacterized protein YigE (DUF2233 family)
MSTGESYETLKKFLPHTLVQMGSIKIQIFHFSTQSQIYHKDYKPMMMVVNTAANSSVSTVSHF